VVKFGADVSLLAEIMAETESTDWLLDLLRDVQLEQFYVKLRDNLQVTRSADPCFLQSSCIK